MKWNKSEHDILYYIWNYKYWKKREVNGASSTLSIIARYCEFDRTDRNNLIGNKAEVSLTNVS